MKEIKLTRGKVALVDDEDFIWLNHHNWHAVWDYSNWYAVRHRGIRMHREIMKAEKGQEVDHKDGNGLNNQKENLRPATRMQNARNTKKHSNSKSRFKGVWLHPTSKRWQARITVNKERIHLGFFAKEQDAAAAYNVAVQKYHQDFGCTTR